jgi:hypothetical protein
MAESDLAKLRIQRGGSQATAGARRRRRVWRWVVVAMLAALAIGYFVFVYKPSVAVETATVAQVYPS